MTQKERFYEIHGQLLEKQGYKVRVLDDTDMIEEDGCREKLLGKEKIKYMNELNDIVFEVYKGVLEMDYSKNVHNSLVKKIKKLGRYISDRVLK